MDIKEKTKTSLFEEYRGTLFHVPEAAISFCGRRKISPLTGEVIESVCANRPIFRAEKAVEGCEVSPKPCRASAEGDRGEGQARAAARARKQLFDYVACNPFDYFITLTQDAAKVGDRYDYKEAVYRLGVWLDNRVRRNGLKYVIVPEKHKDGAIHWHGLVTQNGIKLADSGHKDKAGRKIYNIVNWRFGFTTAVKLDGNYSRVAGYVTKYIKKDMDAGTIGGRYFLHGGALQGPRYEYYDAPLEGTEGKAFEIPEAGLTLTYF